MAVWRRSTRRKGSCSSNSSAESGYKPNSPTQASTAPSKANLPLNNHRNESRLSVHRNSKSKKCKLNTDMIKKRGRPLQSLAGNNFLNKQFTKKRGRPPKFRSIPKLNDNDKCGNVKKELIKNKKLPSRKLLIVNRSKKFKNGVINKKRGRPPKSLLFVHQITNFKLEIVKKRGRKPKPAVINRSGWNKLKNGFVEKRGKQFIRKKISKEKILRGWNHVKNEIIKRRGRPPKNTVNQTVLDNLKDGIKKKRGRPPKKELSRAEFNKLKHVRTKHRSLPYERGLINRSRWNDKKNELRKKRGRPPKRTIDNKVQNNLKNHNVKQSSYSLMCITDRKEWRIGLADKYIKKRGRPRKNLLITDYVCKHQHHDLQNNFKEHGNNCQVSASLNAQNDRSEMSDYEKLRLRRREEILSMFRELFSVETDGTLKSDENNSMKRRKYCRRPLPPSRPRSLRLQGLSPGQRPLRNRTRSTTGPRCLCCCMLPQCNRIRKNTSLCQV